MKAVKTEISGVDVLFEIADDNIEIINDKEQSENSEAVEVTSHENITDLVQTQGIANLGRGKSSNEITDKDVKKASEIIAAFAKDCKSKLDTDISPDEIEIEFSLSLGGKAGGKAVWVFSEIEAKSSINVKMKWNKNNPAKQGK